MMQAPLIEHPPRVIVQLIFSLRLWTPRQAKAWAAEHGYRIDKTRINDHYTIVHQRNESEVFHRTVQSESVRETPGLSFVTGVPKTHYVAALS